MTDVVRSESRTVTYLCSVCGHHISAREACVKDEKRGWHAHASCGVKLQRWVDDIEGKNNG